ncbi:conserved hypothetical protein [Methylocella tundrae]|jgi:hypothetical protein|uniref:Uncharacterized protein n=1 Tax=Methylocella tundrae TaxID=227605 RepID=A0A8B6M4T8_METTU|nr:hypothetical protein [Methylocella tundrae]VTZ25782.1 conserved hypothetical protein [Methylocella tundrae]VTZ49369.1 conserved hypothetical protein [Methylocella tundrae]
MAHTPDFMLIRAVLLRDWEPIICNELLPDDEYDDYIPQLMELLEAGASQERIANYLSRVESVTMGVPTIVERTGRVASNLIVAWKAKHKKP